MVRIPPPPPLPPPPELILRPYELDVVELFDDDEPVPDDVDVADAGISGNA